MPASFRKAFLIVIMSFAVTAPNICLGQLTAMSSSQSTKTIVITNNKPFDNQLVSTNAIYVIRNKINLNGKQVIIPSNCEIRFSKGGQLVNGAIIGDGTILGGELIGVLNEITISGTFNNTKITSSLFQTPPMLSYLVSLICDDGIIDLDNDINHDGTIIEISKSFTIQGGEHVIKIRSEGLKTGGLFKVKGAQNITLSNVVIDGGLPVDAYKTRQFKGQDNFKWLICAENCDKVKIDNCIFKNMFFQMSRCPDYPYTLEKTNSLTGKSKEKQRDFVKMNLYNIAHFAMISFIYCKDVQFIGNRFENVNSEEGIMFLADNQFIPPVQSNDDFCFNAQNNVFACTGSFSKGENRFLPDESTISSWITVLYGKSTIIANDFGACGGSQLNVFSSNSIVENNVFRDSRSGSIDLNESGLLGFVPENVIVKNNRAYNTLYFIQLSAGRNILIEDNIFDCTGIPEGYGSENNMFVFCNRNTNDFAAPKSLFHPVRDLVIKNNKSYNALWFFCDWNYGEQKNEKKGLIIDSNEIVNRTKYANTFKNGNLKSGLASERPALCISSFSNVKITNNSIEGTGNPKVFNGRGSEQVPSYIMVLQPSKNSYFKDIDISNNNFECKQKNAKLLTYSILDSKISKKRKYKNGIGMSNVQTLNNNIVVSSK